MVLNANTANIKHFFRARKDSWTFEKQAPGHSPRSEHTINSNLNLSDF